MNLDAWIDCLSYLDEDDDMSQFRLVVGETSNIEVLDTESFIITFAGNLLRARGVQCGCEPAAYQSGKAPGAHNWSFCN